MNKRKIKEIVNHDKIALARALNHHYCVHYSNTFDRLKTREQLYSARRRIYSSLKKQPMKSNKSFSGEYNQLAVNKLPPVFIKQEKEEEEIKKLKMNSYKSSAKNRAYMQMKRRKPVNNPIRIKEF